MNISCAVLKLSTRSSLPAQSGLCSEHHRPLSTAEETEMQGGEKSITRKQERKKLHFADLYAYSDDAECPAAPHHSVLSPGNLPGKV